MRLPKATENYDTTNEQQTRRALESAIDDIDGKLSSLLTSSGTLAANIQNLTVANGVNNNVALGYGTYTRLSGPTASFTLTGLTGGESGRVLLLRNTTAYDMTLSNDSGLSTAKNRILTQTGADITLSGTGGSSALLFYDGASERWILVAGDPSSDAVIAALDARLDAVEAELAIPVTPTQQIFTASGTWTRPTGCVAVSVLVVGGGGGGGTPTALAANVGLGGSGGGGGASFKTVDVTAISSVSVTVGAGGTGGASAGTSGSAGGTSSFGSHCSATGGGGGSTLAAGTVAGRVLGGAGGSGSSGDVNLTGGSAGLSIRIDGSSGGGISAEGGSSYFGGGGRGSGSGSGGSTGGDYGGGGSGGVTNSATDRFGGSGAGGIVIVTEYYQ